MEETGAGAERVAPGATADDEARASASPTALSVALILVYLAIAWPALIGPDQPNTAKYIVPAVLASAVWLVIVAAIAVTIRRWRLRRDPQLYGGVRPSLGNALLSVPVILVAMLVVVLGGAARHINVKQQPAQASANARAASPQVQRDRRALAAWIRATPKADEFQAQAIRDVQRFEQGLKASRLDLRLLQSAALAAQHEAERFVSATRAQPTATPAVRHVAQIEDRSAQLLLSGTPDFVRAIEQRDGKLISAGGDELVQAGAYATRAAGLGDALYQRLGGAAAFRSQLNFQALWDQLQQARNAGSP